MALISRRIAAGLVGLFHAMRRLGMRQIERWKGHTPTGRFPADMACRRHAMADGRPTQQGRPPGHRGASPHGQHRIPVIFFIFRPRWNMRQKSATAFIKLHVSGAAWRAPSRQRSGVDVGTRQYIMSAGSRQASTKITADDELR